MSPLVRWIVFPIIACVISLTLLSAPSSASRKGKALHKQAVAAFSDGNYVKAKKLWEKAYALDRAPKYLYNLARLGQEMDRPVMALEYFERFLSLSRGIPKFGKLRQRARKHAGALKKRVASITVIVPQQDARAFLDQKSLGQGPIRSTQRVRSGEHVISVNLEGHHGVTRTVHLRGGEKREITIRLKKIKAKVVTKPGKLKYPLPRWLPWVGLGVGLAIAAGGAGSLVVSQNTFDEYDRLVGIDPANPDTELEKKAIMYRSLGWSLLVIGGVTAVSGLIGVFLNRPKLMKADDKDKPAESSVRPSLLVVPVFGPYTGVGMTLRF